MKLISELTEDVKYLVEEKSPGKKEFYIEGVFLQGDILTNTSIRIVHLVN